MRTKLFSLLLAATLCSVHAEQIILDDAVTYELDNTSMTASLVKSAYPYGLMTGYYRETETIRDTIFYEGEKYPVTKIEEKAFYAQVRLKGVTIPSGVKTIGKEAFAECSALPAIELPNSVDSLGDMAFARCTSITTIDIPQAAEVGEGLCAQCYKLVTASIGGNIPNNCFQYCSKLCSITIGNYCTRIGRDAFNGCTALSNIIIPNNVDSIGVQAFMNSGLSVVSIPSNVKKIDESTFAHCSNLESVSLGIGVKRIEKTAFWDCPSLTEITIPEQVEYIGLNAFIGCTSLSSVIWNAENCAIYNVVSQRPFSNIENNITSFVFGEQVQNIPDNLCTGMQNLKRITAYMANPPQISASVFANCGNLKEIVCYVPAATLSAYKTANVWKDFNVTAIGQEPVILTYYSVTFKDWDGTILKIEQVEEGASATAPENPTRDSYTFTGWDKDFSNVTSDLIVTAQYIQNTPSSTYYTVTFKDWDGAVLGTQQVKKGESATAPADPTREGYTFIGWDKNFSNVQSNLVVTAQYQKNETLVAITVRLKASSVSSWSKVNLYYWADGISSPAWPGISLNKDANGWHSYTFDASVKSVNIIWNDGNNQTVDITNVTESTCYSLKSTTGTKIAVYTEDCEVNEAIEEIEGENDKHINKILHNGQILILRGDKTYTLQGQKVK